MKTQNLLCLRTILLCLVLSTGTLSAQNPRNTYRQKNVAAKPDTNIVTATVTPPSNTDSLQHVIDSLRNTIAEMKDRYEEQQQALEQARVEADSLRQYCYCDMTYVLNYGNALLYRKYHARTEDIAKMLATAPDSIKQKNWEQTMTLARQMVNSSNVNEEIRSRVFRLLGEVSQDEAIANDIRNVLTNVPDDLHLELNLTQQAISLIDAMPKSITENNDLYATIRELLVTYPIANEEIKNVLTSIQDDPNNSINISDKRQAFINRIKSTDYYKRYYTKPWNIPYLNSIITQAVARLQNATSRVDFQDLIDEL